MNACTNSGVISFMATGNSREPSQANDYLALVCRGRGLPSLGQQTIASQKREKTPLFASAADLWLAGKSGLAETSKQRYKECVAVLKEEFGKRLVCDFDGNDIAEYQRKRLAEGLSGRTVNYEVGSLRGILRQFGLWGAIA